VEKFRFSTRSRTEFGERFLQVRSVAVLLEAEQIQSGRSPTARFRTNRRLYNEFFIGAQDEPLSVAMRVNNRLCAHDRLTMISQYLNASDFW